MPSNSPAASRPTSRPASGPSTASATRPARPAARKPPRPPRSGEELAKAVEDAIAELRRRANQETLDGMARYNLPSDKAFGVPVGSIKQLGKSLAPDHELAAALWDTGWYEARMLAAFVDDPAAVTPSQMDRWARAFDSWGICDTVCFHLFDRTPHAWAKIAQWSERQEEFVKRGGFAMLASLTVHDKRAPDDLFVNGLERIERAATDDRNFVRLAVNWALRSIGKRNPSLNRSAVVVARRLAASEDASARWVGSHALREITSDAVSGRLAARGRKKAGGKRPRGGASAGAGRR